MRIALMTNNYKPFLGGVPISVERLARALREQGHEVTVFAPTYEGQKEEAGVFRYGTFLKHFIGGIVLPNPFDRHIEQEFRKQDFDVIHVHHPVLIGHTALRLSKKYHIPLAFTYHTRYEQYLSYLGGIRALEGWAVGPKRLLGPLAGKILYLIREVLVPYYLRMFMRRCDRVFAPTEEMLEYLHGTCRIEYEKLAVLPTGIERRQFRAEEAAVRSVRKRYGAEDCPLFLSVSRMSHEKNVEFLIKSAALAKRKMQEQGGCRKFRLVLAGDGPDRAEYEELCRRLRVAEEVVFAGSIPNEEITPYFAAADAFLFASKTETQGIVILEAFAGGTPVWAVDASGVRDIVQDGVNGRLLAENTEEYAEELVRLVHGEIPLERYAERSYREALMYGEEIVARRAISGYTYVCQQKNEESGKELWINIAS